MTPKVLLATSLAQNSCRWFRRLPNENHKLEKWLLMPAIGIALVLLFFSLFAAAQTTNGVPPFASIGGSPHDHLNLAILNGQFVFGITSKPGRGVGFSYALSYNNSIWFPSSAGSTTAWQPVQNYGWQAQTDATLGYVPHRILSSRCRILNPDGTWGYSYWTTTVFSGYQDPGGTLHSMPVSTTAGSTDCGVDPVDSGSSSATDGSGYTLTVTQFNNTVVQSRSGTLIYSASGGSLNDSNGNILSTAINGSTTTFTDTLGATALTISGAPPGNVTYTFPNSSGGNSTVTVAYTSFNIQTNFQCSGVNEYSATGVNLPTSITQADGSQYQIAYEQTPSYGTGYTTGRIASLTLPTGGTISYSYSGSNHGINCSDGSISGLTRTLKPSANANEGNWTYTRSWSGSKTSTTVQDPAGNQTVIQFQGIFETQRDIYNGSAQTGTLLATIYTCYNGAAYPCTNTGVSLPITRLTTTTNINGFYKQADVTYNSSGLPLVSKEYDFGSGAPGALLKEVDITYATISGIQDRPSDIVVKNGSGARVAETQVVYDQSAIVSTTGASSHDYTDYGFSFTTRGNPTTISRWVSGTTFIITTNTYNDLGNLVSSTDQGGHVTAFDYTDSYSDSTNHNTQAFVTTITYPATNSGNTSHIEKKKYYWPTGALYQATDQNNQVTSFTYDSAGRPSTVSYPDGGQSTFTYPNAQQARVQKKIDSSNSADAWTEVDGLGRPSRASIANGESTPYDQTDTCYDPINAKVTTSYAYQGSGLASGPNGTKQCSASAGDVAVYDALGRTTSVTHADGTSALSSFYGRAVKLQDEGNGSGSRVTHVYQMDGLGRTTTVCEQASSIFASTTVACGLDIDGSVNGVNTTYAYDALGNVTSIAQGALTTRQFTYDGVSNVLSEYVSEAKATTNYTYNSEGLLATRSRYSANQPASCIGAGTCTTTTTNYSYDELHRPRTISYNDTTAENTPFLVYFYDQPNPYGMTTGPYQNGNLTSAWTETHSWTGIQGVLFGYDQMGRENIEGQTVIGTCCGSGFRWYSLNYGYNLLGLMTSSTNSQGVTFNYSYNVGARPTQMTSSLADANHPGTLFSQAHYNAGGELTSDLLGNGVSQSFNYDPMWRLLSASAVKGSTTLYSLGGPGAGNTLTYAPNSSITAANDSVNGNWNYSYDALNRIASANKSGGTNLSFDIDRNGNRWHQNPAGAQVSFDQTTNQIASGNGVSYDALGNIINDGQHSYTYDAEGRLTQVDGGATATYVYDVFGRRTRRTVSSGTFDDVYDLGGKMVAEVYATGWGPGEVYLGGHLATYSNGTTYFPLADWLGSERARTDMNGNVVGTCTGNPYGDNYTCAGTDPSRIKYAGMEYDSETGLYHTPFRYYNPRLGLWMSVDPAGMGAADASDPQSFNRFAYVAHNPINSIDPMGLDGNCGWWDHVFDTCAGGYPPGPSINCIEDGVATPCGTLLRQLNLDEFGFLRLVLKGASSGHWEYSYFPPTSVSTNLVYNGDMIYQGVPTVSMGYGLMTWVPDGSGITFSLAFGYFGGGGSGGDNFSWWKEFARTFFTEPYRKPGENFVKCWNRAAGDTLRAAGLPSDYQMGTEALAGASGAVGLFESIKSFWASGFGGKGWVRPSSMLARQLFSGSPAATTALRWGGKGLAVIGAAEVGLRTGSALDCAIPNNY
jgi:RHS repeat-associated protein